MKKIINSEGHFVAEVDEKAKTVIIVRRGCETYITINRDGTITVINISSNAITDK